MNALTAALLRAEMPQANAISPKMKCPKDMQEFTELNPKAG